MNITQNNTAILQGGWTNDQLSSMIDAVKFARARLTEQTKRTLRIGDNVNFNSTKLGRNVTGVVVKIAIKFVTVKTVSGLWRVPANMLTVVADEQEFA
jgi:small-conductance mechanosensitive channel